MDILNTRRSIRKFNNKEVSKEDINKIVRLAMQAPSARCQMPWELLVVTDKEKMSKCAKMLPNTHMLESASFCIVFMTNTSNLKTPGMYPQDLASSVTYSLLEARKLNIGSCWCGIYPNNERMNVVREIFKINKDYLEPFAVVAYGYPESEEDFKYIDRYDESKVHYEEI